MSGFEAAGFVAFVVVTLVVIGVLFAVFSRARDGERSGAPGRAGDGSEGGH